MKCINLLDWDAFKSDNTLKTTCRAMRRKTDTFEARETASSYFSGAKFFVDFDAHIRCERATADF